ncbi:hypothetical protein M5D96_014233 [Drosophila gunungcola]|uniref:Tubulin beta chain n=1 Tax=Drosophila gunungcola TaxID=103775 RepID=A0A9P9YAL3_9MUSC|nr:hypothetical protein M5D96_014233 [Drosophila gunungcola]
MREIVTLQIGGAGNAIGDSFWHVISHEHGVDYPSGRFGGNSPLQLERINVFFNATASKRFYARAILIDTEASTVQRLNFSSQLYRPENFVVGLESAGNNFARGYHTDGAAILEQVLDNTRREVESVDSLQGFQLLHSIAGGTGSGLTSLIMEALVEKYPDNLLCNFVAIPSPNMSQVVVEPYNALLSTSALRNLKIKMSGYEHINHIVALTMSGITTCLRFPGQLNAGLRKQQQFSKGTVSELVQQIFSSNNILCSIDLRKGKLLTAAGLFRGRMSPQEVDQLMTGNTSAIQSLFQRLLDGSMAMLRRKAHLHWYTGEGMEEQEFLDAQQELQAIIDDYKSSAEGENFGGDSGRGGIERSPDDYEEKAATSGHCSFCTD